MGKPALTICGALVFAVSFIARSGSPWSLPEVQSIEGVLWKVPAGTIAMMVLPLLVAVLMRWMNSLRRTDPAGKSSRTLTWLRTLAGWVFWIGAALIWVIDPVTAHIILTLMVWCGLHTAAALQERTLAAGIPFSQSEDSVALLFFASGFSALIYQIVWQRTLYAMFGVDIESVTIIVSVFMFGLGIGAIAGTMLLRINRRLLTAFVVIELGIGAFGAVSIDIAGQLQVMMTSGSRWSLIAASYALFALPTLLMGATLPILVGYLNGHRRNIGRSTGLLYAVNTWGSALAALLTVTVILAFTGLRGAAWIAAALNFATACGAMLIQPRLGMNNALESRPSAKSRLPIGFSLALLLSFWVGFLALSQELIWFRLLGIATETNPRVFGVMLSLFLLGIGWGSIKVKTACELGKDPASLASRMLLIAAILSFLSVPAVALGSALSGREFGALIGLACCGVIAGCTGGILPVLTTMGITDDPAVDARRAGWVYAANIAGAASGPLLAGYVLFNYLHLELIAAIVALGLLLLVPFFSLDRMRAWKTNVVFLLSGIALYGPLNSLALERIHTGEFSPAPFSHRIENRSSVVATISNPDGDIIYGGGVYDGRINTDLVHNTNGIDRAFIVAALHPDPRQVLEIGLSGGSWAAVISSFAGLEQLTSVEINPGYLQLAASYPETAVILDHPKVMIAIDDGRRWLRHNPDRKFDVIVMNTTFHWRAQASSLLSMGFMQEARGHLAPGGVFYFNSTGSEDAVFTAARVFQHVVLVENFVAARDSPFDMSTEERRANLMRYLPGKIQSKDSGRPDLAGALARMAERPLHDVGAAYRGRTDLHIITDDNLFTEFKL